MAIVIVLPTRNRASLAMNAIRSVMDQPVAHTAVSLIVSDNSTECLEADLLRDFCQRLGEHRVRYVRPPAPLPMPAHWQWALDHALRSPDATHVTYLTDRMILRPGQLGKLVDLVADHPHMVISYNHDRVIDHSSPIRLDQYPWSGALVQIKSSRLLEMTSKLSCHNCFPRMMNCVVPRGVLQAIRDRFGVVFGSVAPDFHFCFRCLITVDSILYYDKPVLVHYALDRSNGESQARGIASKDHLDFMAHLRPGPMNFAAPIPQLTTVTNTIAHEYCVAYRELNGQGLASLDRERYLEAISQEVERMEDPEARTAGQELLAAHGWIPRPTKPAFKKPARRHFWNRWASIFLWYTTGPRSRPLWLWLALRCGIRPPKDVSLEFRSADEAIQYANRCPRRKASNLSHLRMLLEATPDTRLLRDATAEGRLPPTAQPDSFRAPSSASE